MGIAMGNWGVPVWAVTGASFLRKAQPLPGIERLLIGADHDPPDEDGKQASQDAARECARRWMRAGISVGVRVPKIVGWDFADVYRRRS